MEEGWLNERLAWDYWGLKEEESPLREQENRVENCQSQ
jgi:hypothetical protein